MQRIERYGVLAFLFLVITAIVVPMWGGDAGDRRAENGAVAMNDAPPAAPRARAEQPEAARGNPKRVEGGIKVSPRATPAGSGSLRVVPDAVQPQRSSQAAAGEPAAGDAAFERQQQRRPRRTGPRVAGAEPAAGGAGTAPARQPAAARPQQPPPPQEQHQRQRQEPAGEALAAGARGLPAGESPAPRNEPLRIGRAEPGAARALPATYTIAPGDTLSEIAEKTLGSSERWGEIQALNGIADPGRLIVGQRLKLPGDQSVSDRARPDDVASAQPPAPAPRPAPAPAAGGRTYRVQPGDVLSVIAQRELGSARRWGEIVALNPGLDEHHLIVGARLALPAGAAAPERTMLASREPAPRGSESSAEEGRFRVR